MDLAPSQRFTPVTQFSVFLSNRIGKLNELLQVLSSSGVHLAAFSTVDTSEAVLLRMVVNYPEAARRALEDGGYPFSEHRIFAVEIASEQVLSEITAAMTEAEINVLYAYSFLMRPGGKSGLAMCVDDNDLASQVLFAHGFRILCQQDIAR
jgi:hypothetical protein